MDKNGQSVNIGDSVNVDETETNLDFLGTVDSFRGDLIVVCDMEDNFFCVEPKNIELEN